MSIFIPKKLVLKFYTNSADKIQSTWQVDKSILPHANQTIFNIKRWLAGSMGQRTVELGFLGDFVLLLFKTCSLDHEKLFIKKVNDICSQVFNNFFSASDIMEAVRGRFCFYRYECKVAWYKLDCCEVYSRQRVAFSILMCRAVGRGEGYGGASALRPLFLEHQLTLHKSRGRL